MVPDMYDIGVVVGKFAPLTRGHINLIAQASLQAKKVIVVLSHDERWLLQQNPRDRKALAFKNRLRWLQQIYFDMEHVEIQYIIEDDIPEFPNGWAEYSRLLMDVINKASQKHIDSVVSKVFPLLYNHVGLRNIQRPTVAIFSSEIGYDANYAHYLPLVHHVVVDADRASVPISATKIRENLYQYWDYLPTLVRKEFTRKVVIIGTESSGKTTLVKNLAKYFNTSWVEEYGRVFCEKEIAGSEATLRSEDYPLIAYRHKELEETAMRTANRLCIVDTNALVTEYYHRLYEGVPNAIVSAIAASEHYDLVIILDPTVPWVNDGLRLNSDREKTTPFFEELLAEFPNQTPAGFTHRISDTDYYTRFNKVRDIIEQFSQQVGIGAC